MTARIQSSKPVAFAEIAAKRHVAALAADENAEDQHTEELDALWRDMSPDDRQIAESLASAFILRAELDSATAAERKAVAAIASYVLATEPKP
jgi:hypothetical protein